MFNNFGNEAASNNRRRNEDTKSRIFGMSCDELDKLEEKKKIAIAAVKSRGKGDSGSAKKDSAAAAGKPLESATIGDAKKDTATPQIGCRESAESRKHQMMEQQKKWLDEQLEERKNRDQKFKKMEKQEDEMNAKRNALGSSNSDRMMANKQEMEQQIAQYNEMAAKQKRNEEKKLKENDKKDPNEKPEKLTAQESQKVEDDKEEMIQLERAMSRDIRQMAFDMDN
jgi:hypothetical protein